MNEQIKSALDWPAVGVTLAAAVQWINILLAIPAAIYTCLRIYEWFEKRRKRKESEQ
jgi:hypothetical protein